MIKFIIRFFCKHEYKVISPEFCMGKGKMARLCECQKCGKNKIVQAIAPIVGTRIAHGMTIGWTDMTIGWMQKMMRCNRDCLNCPKEDCDKSEQFNMTKSWNNHRYYLGHIEKES